MTQPQRLDPLVPLEGVFIEALTEAQKQFPQLRSIAVVMDWHEGTPQELSGAKGMVLDQHGALPVDVSDLTRICGNLIPGLVGLASNLLVEFRNRFTVLQFQLSSVEHAKARGSQAKEPISVDHDSPYTKG